MNKCELCGGIGVRFVNGVPIKCSCTQNLGNFKRYDEDELIEKIVPDKYRDMEFDIVRFKELYSNDRNIISYKHVITVMNNLNKAVNNALKPLYSLFLYFPYGCNEDEFVYITLKDAIKSGFKVVPYIDTMDFDRLINKEIDDIEGFNLDDFFDSDIMFLKLPYGLIKARDVQIARIIVDKRARKNNATMIISNIPYEYLVKVDPFFARFVTDKNDEASLSRLLYIAIQIKI